MLILLKKDSREPEGPVASVRGGRDVTDRPWCEVLVEYYCFFIITIVGSPYFLDPVWPLK